MRELDIAGTEVATALGFSPQYTQTQVKVLCRGSEKDSGQVVMIVELRIQRRKQPLVQPKEAQGNGDPTKPRRLKGPGKPMTPHKALLQSILD
jgi:hypothetical protein